MRMATSTKARLNLTIDPDIYREAKRIFSATELNMSTFMEIQLAKFLQDIQPLIPLIDQVESGERNAADAKAAVRIWFAHSIGQSLSDTYKVAHANVSDETA